MKIGYIIGSHVVYNHIALPILMDSMFSYGIDRSAVVVNTNGSTREHDHVHGKTRYIFSKEDAASHLTPIVSKDLGTEMGITHWFYLDCTARCGPRFKELVESGFDPEADCTLAAVLIPLASRGSEGRAMNNMCMYSHAYLMAQKDEIMSQRDITSCPNAVHLEGELFAIAPKKARYPNLGYTVKEASDIYDSGTPRITEYHHAVDLFRFKKNWGQFVGGEYEAARL